MLAVVDCRTNEKPKETLYRLGYKVIALPPYGKLEKAVASHPDMLIFPLCGKLITSKEYYNENRSLLDEILFCAGFELLISEKEIGDRYPDNVCFNAARVGKYLIANTEYTAKEILSVADEIGLIPINIKQGYSKCSICVVSEDAVITSDSGIYKTLSEKTDLDVLKIREGFVDLPPFAYGFIGGATGADNKNVYFCGDLNTHPDADKIRAFCQKHSKNAVSLSGGNLIDVGTIFLF